jgi:hypothetical protein
MYRFEWIPGPFLLALVVILPLAPAFAMIAVVIAALAAVVAAIALAGAVMATPYLIVRTVRRHLAERHQPADAPVSIGTAPRSAVAHG